MASGWNLCVWLQCIGVVSGCCCKEVHMDILTIIINFPYSTCIVSSFFWQQHPYFFVHLIFFFSVLVYLCLKI